MPDYSDLCCPRCAADLTAAQDALLCRACNLTFATEGGIVDLRCGRHDYYFNPVPAEQMRKLTDGMTEASWPETIRQFIREVRMNPSWLDNLIVDGRYAWKLLLDLRPDMKILDLGCGLGNLTHNLAPLVSRVYAMDLTLARLQFSQKRFSIFNRQDDIMPIAGGDGVHLPFRSASLDCVVVSGVLEWVGEGDTSAFSQGGKAARLLRMLRYHFGENNPRRIQLRFLREIRRILKPAGQLFVAIENRLNHEYFAGRRDHHSLLYFGSLLPRFLATLYSLAASRKPYRTYTYSIPGYRKLLAEAGFPNVEFLGFSRGYSALEEILPSDVEAPTWKPASPATFKDAVRRNKYFVPAYGIISSTAPKPWRRRQDALLAAVERHARDRYGDGRLQQHSYDITGRQKLILRATYGSHPLIIRVPMNAASRAAEETNAAVLRRLGEADHRQIPAPGFLCSGEADGIWFAAEEELKGKPLAETLTARGRTSMLAEVASILARLESFQPTQRARLADRLYEEHVGLFLRTVAEATGDAGLSADMEACFHELLYGADVTLGLMHGDFGTRNLLVDADRISGLIDWEGGDPTGIPLLDAINYLTSVHLLFNPALRMSHITPLLASGDWPERDEREFLAQRFASLTMETTRHTGWVYLSWLHGIARRLANIERFDPRLIERDVKDVFRGMLAGAGARQA